MRFSLLLRRAALVLQIMWDRKEKNNEEGRSSYSVC